MNKLPVAINLEDFCDDMLLQIALSMSETTRGLFRVNYRFASIVNSTWKMTDRSLISLLTHREYISARRLILSGQVSVNQLVAVMGWNSLQQFIMKALGEFCHTDVVKTINNICDRWPQNQLVVVVNRILDAGYSIDMLSNNIISKVRLSSNVMFLRLKHAGVIGPCAPSVATQHKGMMHVIAANAPIARCSMNKFVTLDITAQQQLDINMRSKRRDISPAICSGRIDVHGCARLSPLALSYHISSQIRRYYESLDGLHIVFKQRLLINNTFDTITCSFESTRERIYVYSIEQYNRSV